MILILPGNKDVPAELLNIQQVWRQKADEYGDVGSCVVGAGFVFTYKGQKYKMPPISKWQGSISWEHCIDEILEMLRNAGCEDIQYDYGILD